MDDIIEMLKHVSDEKLQEIIFDNLGSMRRERELLHLALAEKARRTLGVERITEEDIA